MSSDWSDGIPLSETDFIAIVERVQRAMMDDPLAIRLVVQHDAPALIAEVRRLQRELARRGDFTA